MRAIVAAARSAEIQAIPIAQGRDGRPAKARASQSATCVPLQTQSRRRPDDCVPEFERTHDSICADDHR
eukprot:3326677-Prymnesium_polylepis.1